MSLVASFVSRLMAVLDRVLFYFAQYDRPYGNLNTDPCDILGEATLANAWMTPCGESFVQNTAVFFDLIRRLCDPIQTALLIIGGLFAIN